MEEIAVDNYSALDAPLFWQACRSDDVATVLQLIKEADELKRMGGHDLASFWGEEEGEGFVAEGTKLPIHEACESGSAEVLRVLLQARAAC